MTIGWEVEEEKEEDTTEEEEGPRGPFFAE